MKNSFLFQKRRRKNHRHATQLLFLSFLLLLLVLLMLLLLYLMLHASCSNFIISNNNVWKQAERVFKRDYKCKAFRNVSLNFFTFNCVLNGGGLGGYAGRVFDQLKQYKCQTKLIWQELSIYSDSEPSYLNESLKPVSE